MYIEIFGLYFPLFQNPRLWSGFPDRKGGQVGLRRTKDFLSDEDTTCSVRLNRESSFVGLLRDVHGALWSDEASFPPLPDSVLQN